MTVEAASTPMGITGVVLAWVSPYLIDLMEYLPSDVNGWLTTVAQIGGLILLFFSIMIKINKWKEIRKNKKNGKH